MGWQLLDDFEADDRMTVRRMVARRHWSPSLRRIIAMLADMCVRFEKRLSTVSAQLLPPPSAAVPVDAALDTGAVANGQGAALSQR